jgi:hypothetical protein
MSTISIDILDTLSIEFAELDEILQVSATLFEKLDLIENNSYYLDRFNLL